MGIFQKNEQFFKPMNLNLLFIALLLTFFPNPGDLTLCTEPQAPIPPHPIFMNDCDHKDKSDQIIKK